MKPIQETAGDIAAEARTGARTSNWGLPADKTAQVDIMREEAIEAGIDPSPQIQRGHEASRQDRPDKRREFLASLSGPAKTRFEKALEAKPVAGWLKELEAKDPEAHKGWGQHYGPDKLNELKMTSAAFKVFTERYKQAVLDETRNEKSNLGLISSTMRTFDPVNIGLSAIAASLTGGAPAAAQIAGQGPANNAAGNIKHAAASDSAKKRGLELPQRTKGDQAFDVVSGAVSGSGAFGSLMGITGNYRYEDAGCTQNICIIFTGYSICI